MPVSVSNTLPSATTEINLSVVYELKVWESIPTESWARHKAVKSPRISRGRMQMRSWLHSQSWKIFYLLYSCKNKPFENKVRKITLLTNLSDAFYLFHVVI